MHRILLAKSMDLARQGHPDEALACLYEARETAFRFLGGAAGFNHSKSALDKLRVIHSMAFYIMASHPCPAQNLSGAQTLISQSGVSRDLFQEVVGRNDREHIESRTDNLTSPVTGLECP